MANLGQKDGIHNIRFRYRGKEYKRSLKVRDAEAAAAARHSVELTIHRLVTGLLQLPEGVDPGDFILSGGTLIKPPNAVDRPIAPSTRATVDEYLSSQKNLLADSYHYTQKVHLNHLMKFLGDRAEEPSDLVADVDLGRYITTRLKQRNPGTAERERITLMQFYKWTVGQKYLQASPAAGLAPIKSGVDRPPFRTIAEINRIIDRGGLSDEEALDLWECLYLTPEEIAGLLAKVRERAVEDYAYFLHAIPAYTGMRRGEVLRLRWADVDLDSSFLYARSRKQSRKKTETIRRIDLHPELLNDLIDWRKKRPRGQYVVCSGKTLEPVRVDQANRHFWQPMRGTDWCLNAKCNWFKIGFHSYRHSFASNLAALGVDQRIIDEWMGHQTEAMRKRYRHLFPKDRRSAIESFSLAVASKQ